MNVLAAEPRREDGRGGRMVDERERRLDGFDEAGSVPILLGDGQRWWFRVPRMVTRVHVLPDGSLAARPGARGYSEDWGDAMARLYDEESLAARFAGVAGLALQLLRANYDIPDALVPELFVFDAEDEGLIDAWAELNQLVQGVVPKPSAAGSATPSSPAASSPAS